MLQNILFALIAIIGFCGSCLYCGSSRKNNLRPVKKAHLPPPQYKLSDGESRRIADRKPVEVVKVIEYEPVQATPIRNQDETGKDNQKPDSNDPDRDMRSLFLEKDKGIYHDLDLITKQGWIDLEYTVLELGRLPSGASGLLEALNSPDTEAKDISALCERSVGLTARILKLVNSPFYGLRSKTDNIQQAVTYLGFDEIRQIILTTSIFNTRDRKGGPVRVEELWVDFLATARITTWLNDRVKVKGRKNLAGTGAMLHDIGKLVLQNWRPEGFRKAVVRSREMKTPLLQEEIAELGLTHALAGVMLMHVWRLPLTLQWLVKGCHIPETNPDMPETALVYLSGQIARCMSMGLDGEDASEIPGEIRELLGFKAETLEELIGEGFEEYVSEVLAGLQIPVNV